MTYQTGEVRRRVETWYRHENNLFHNLNLVLLPNEIPGNDNAPTSFRAREYNCVQKAILGRYGDHAGAQESVDVRELCRLGDNSQS